MSSIAALLTRCRYVLRLCGGLFGQPAHLVFPCAEVGGDELGVPPADRMSATTASPRALSRPLTMTNAPSAASADGDGDPETSCRTGHQCCAACQPRAVWTHASTGPLQKWTCKSRNSHRKGQATRQRIIEGAAAEIRERGVAVATLDDIRARTQTSKSQLFHYFPDGKEQLLLAVAEHEAQMVLDDQQPYLGALTSWAAWQRWRDAVVDRYRRQGQHCPLAVLMSEIGRSTPGAQAVTSALMRKWHDEIAAGVRHMQAQGKVVARLDADRVAAALLAGIQGGVGVMLATGDLSYLEAALDAGIESLRAVPFKREQTQSAPFSRRVGDLCVCSRQLNWRRSLRLC